MLIAIGCFVAGQNQRSQKMSNFLPINVILEFFDECKGDINSVCDFQDEHDIINFIRTAIKEKIDYLSQEEDDSDHLDATYKQGENK